MGYIHAKSKAEAERRLRNSVRLWNQTYSYAKQQKINVGRMGKKKFISVKPTRKRDLYYYKIENVGGK